MNTRRARVLPAVAAALAASTVAHAYPNMIISQGTTMYRYLGGAVLTSSVSDVVNGMTTVPAGVSVGTLNGGAHGGDILALGSSDVYRVDNALTAPTLTRIGVRGGANASPVFIGNRLFGVAGVLPHGSVVVEWDLATFTQINLWPTGVFGGPGGMVAVPGTPDEFYYSEFNTDTIYHYKLGDTFSTPICSTPNNDYVGLEMIGGTIYASYALPGTRQFVLGEQSLTGAFTQIAVLDTYGVGITGLAELVPAPSTVGVLAAAGLTAVRRRRRCIRLPG